MPNPFDDPFGVNARFRDPFGGGGRQPAAIQPLPPQEQESALSKLGQAALGGLGWLGETLDKTFGGRAIRGLLGGKPEEALSLIPFSDTLGITNPENAVSGKELLGYDKHDDSWGGFGSGLGAEILLDPATYLTFGGSALSKLGKGAQKIGTLPTSLAARARGFAAGSAEAAQLASHLGIPAAEVAGRPLGGAASIFGNVLGGETAAKAIDAAKDYLAYSKAGRVAAPLFDSSLHTFGPSPTTEVAQRAVRAGSEAVQGAKPNILLQHFDDAKRLEDAGMHNEAATLRQLVENQFQGAQTPGVQAARQVAGDIGQRNEQMLAEKLGLGLPTGRHQSDFGVEFSHRQMTPDADQLLQKAIGRDKSFAQVRNPDALRRIAELDVPGGTEAINDLLRDPAAVARGTPQEIAAARQYAQTKLGYDPVEHATLQAMNGGKGPMPAIPGFQPGSSLPNPDFQRFQQLQKLQASGNYLADMAAKLPDEFRTGNSGQGLRFFGNSPLGDATQYALNHTKATQGARTWYDIIGKAATPEFTEGAKSIAELLHPKNTTFKTTKDAITGDFRGAIPQVWQRLEKAGLVPGPMPQKLSDAAAALKNLYVPADVAADLQRFGQSFAMPENLKPLLKGWDYATNLTKTGQTVLWPAFHARNFMSGVWQNLIGGAHAGDPLTGLGSALRDANLLRTGKAIPDANTIAGLTHLSPEDATRRIAELAYAHGARVPQDRSLAAELLGKLPQDSGMAGELGTLAGRVDKSPIQSIKEGLGLAADPTNQATSRLGRWNPLDYENFAPAKAGRELSGASDDYNRLAGFLGYLRQGFDPAVAAEKIKNLHFGGGGTSYAPFEREVMRRLVPFYGWSRQNIPFQVQQLLEKPGGMTAQALRATGEMRQQEGMLPDWIGEGMAIPVGAREGNTQRYLSSLGLPFEDLARFVNTGASPVQRTMQEMLGQLNPLLKGPLEYATGMQFHSGRQTQDLYARTGNPILDQIAMNSPISRGVSLFSQLLDPRKGISGFATNAVSPFRLTDVDMERAGAIRERQILNDALRQNPAVRQFLDFYVPASQVPSLDPQTLEQLRLYRTLTDQAKLRGKQAA